MKQREPLGLGSASSRSPFFPAISGITGESLETRLFWLTFPLAEKREASQERMQKKRNVLCSLIYLGKVGIVLLYNQRNRLWRKIFLSSDLIVTEVTFKKKVANRQASVSF